MNSIFKVISKIFGRVIWLYVLGFAVVYWLFVPSGAFTKISLATLDRLRPETVDYLIALHEKKVQPDPQKIRPFKDYYQRVSEFVPDRADANGLFGYCSYYSGEHEKALRAYQKAVQLNPSFFWYYYNLGVIYFKSGQYEKANEVLEKAVAADPQPTFLYIASSARIYLPIVIGLAQPKMSWDQFARQQLKQGYRDSYALLILSQYRLKNFQDMFQLANMAIKLGLDRDGSFYFYAALAAYQLKQYSAAVYFLQEHIKKDPNNPEAYHYLGLILQESGKGPLAEVAFKKEAYLNQTKTGKDSLLNIADHIELKLY